MIKKQGLLSSVAPTVFTEIPLDRMLAAAAPVVERDPVSKRITKITAETKLCLASAAFDRDAEANLEAVTWTLEDLNP